MSKIVHFNSSLKRESLFRLFKKVDISISLIYGAHTGHLLDYQFLHYKFTFKIVLTSI